MAFFLGGGFETDMILSPLLDDGQPDIEGYNKELEQLGYPSWFNIPWLFAECYLYRYILVTHSYVYPNLTNNYFTDV